MTAITLPTTLTPHTLSRAGRHVPRGTGFTFRSMRGLGQGCLSPCFDNPSICCDDPSSTGTSTSTGSGINWNQVIAQGVSAASSAYTKTLQTNLQSQALQTQSLLRAGYAVDPTTGQLVPASSALTAANLGSMMPILLIGGGLLVVVMMAGKR